MVDEEIEVKEQESETEISSDSEQTTTALTVSREDLNKESLELINKIIASQNVEETRDLTYLFNINQNKKTMVRVNKMNDLLDALVDEATKRVVDHPDEITTTEIMSILKTTNDLIEKGQSQVNGTNENTPLIQINQQNNEVHVGDSNASNLNRESRERVKNFVLNLIGDVKKQQETSNAEVVDVIEGEENND